MEDSVGGESGKTGALVLAASSAVLLIASFVFNWYEIDVPAAISTPEGVDLTFNAWDAFDIIDYGVLAVVAIGLIAALITGTRSGDLAFGAGGIAALAGVVGFLVLGYRALDPPTLVINDVAVKEEGGVEIATQIGAFLGVAAMAGIAIGGWLSARASGTSLREVLGRVDRALGDDREATEGPSVPPPPGS
jgi:hypothetical protein